MKFMFLVLGVSVIALNAQAMICKGSDEDSWAQLSVEIQSDGDDANQADAVITESITAEDESVQIRVHRYRVNVPRFINTHFILNGVSEGPKFRLSVSAFGEIFEDATGKRRVQEAELTADTKDGRPLSGHLICMQNLS